MIRARSFLFAFLLTAPILTIGAVAQTPPKFDTSSVTASRSSIVPLETIDYTITIRNSGGSAASYLRVANAIPTSAMFVSASPDWKFIEADRELSWMGNLAPGASKVLRLSLVTRPESAGLTLANRTAIHYDGAYHALDHQLVIDTPPSAGHLLFGGVRITHAGIVVGCMLALGATLYLALRRRGRAGFNTGLAVIILSTGFIVFFLDLAHRDSRAQARFQQTQCMVLDSMARYVESQSAIARKSVETWSPLFALRYHTNRGDVVSVGYATASVLQFGRRNPTADALASLPRGATVPCWFDPDDPKQIVLIRHPGGAYWFALIPLVTLIVGIVFLRTRLEAKRLGRSP